VAGPISMQGSLILPAPYGVTVSSVAGLVAAASEVKVQVFSFPLPEFFQGRYIYSRLLIMSCKIIVIHPITPASRHKNSL